MPASPLASTFSPGKGVSSGHFLPRGDLRIVDDDHPGGTVLTGVEGLIAQIAESPLNRGIVKTGAGRGIPPNRNDLALDVQLGIIVMAQILGADAVPHRHHLTGNRPG